MIQEHRIQSEPGLAGNDFVEKFRPSHCHGTLVHKFFVKLERCVLDRLGYPEELLGLKIESVLSQR